VCGPSRSLNKHQRTHLPSLYIAGIEKLVSAPIIRSKGGGGKEMGPCKLQPLRKRGSYFGGEVATRVSQILKQGTKDDVSE